MLAAGALPLAFPTISLHESFAYPTSMYLRNLMAMDTEEMMKALPLDGCILVGGCDKTVPAQIMGALSARLPFVQLVSGPMLTGSFFGERVGACTDCRRLWAQYRAGDLDDAAIAEARWQARAQIFLHAQCHAESFYARFGFHRVGSIFSEANIEHVKMVLHE